MLPFLFPGKLLAYIPRNVINSWLFCRGAAFTAALAQLGTQAQNTTLVSAVLANHIINGTSLYSPAIALHPSNFLSAGGQPFSFMTNSSGTYVTSGPATARIIRSDVTVTNGVIHVISDGKPS